jgi:hypothetical protein
MGTFVVLLRMSSTMLVGELKLELGWSFVAGSDEDISVWTSEQDRIMEDLLLSL